MYRMAILGKLVFCCLILTVLALTVSAATLTITKTADTNDGVCDADCSLREAIGVAISGDTVVFSPLFSSAQTITLGGTQLTIGVNLTITGAGENLLTVSGNNASRVFLINAGTTVSISGMKITGGNATSPTSGGGIRSSGSLTLTNVDIDTNSANGTGGGIFSNSNLTILNSVVRNNTAILSVGGGIYHGVGTLSITNSTISNNTCPSVNGHGGGVELDTGTGTITNSTIVSNQAGNVGGGISIERGILTVNNSNISNNSAVQSGGGVTHGRTCITPDPCSLTINNSTISNNMMTNPGGGTGAGVFADGDSSLTINSSTISGNIGGGGAGGIAVGGLASTISNSTISGNSGGLSGGIELLSINGDLLTNSTVTNNTATNPAALSVGVRANGLVTVRSTIIAGNVNNTSKPDVSGAFISSGYNLIGNVGTVTDFNQIGDQMGTGAAPINPRLDPLGNYGGPTQTHQLQVSPVVSPAIDAGNSFGLPTDQRGQMRTIDHPSAPFALVGDNTDIGAFEALGPLSATVNISGRVMTAQGNGIRNAFVMVIDSNGNARAVKTGTFGYYSLNNIAVGQTYTITVASKRFEFATQVISLSGELTDLDFIAQ